MTAAGPTIQNGSVLLRDGKIVAVGANLAAPSDAIVVDGTGKCVTPGLIDTHSHLGVYPAPGTSGNNDGNEATSPVTAHVWAEHSVWPQDPQFPRNLAGGITTLQVLPGSANLIGGRGAVLKVVPRRTVQGMKSSPAPSTVSRWRAARIPNACTPVAVLRRAWATSPDIAPPGSAPRRIGGAGTSGTRTSRGRSAVA